MPCAFASVADMCASEGVFAGACDLCTMHTHNPMWSPQQRGVEEVTQQENTSAFN